MPIPSSAIYDYIVRELSPAQHAPDEAPITIVCEPLKLGEGAEGADGAEGARSQGTVSMRLKAGTTPEQARAIASLLQARVKGLCHLESPDEAVS